MSPPATWPAQTLQLGSSLVLHVSPGRIRPEHLQPPRPLAQLAQRLAHDRVERMAGEHGVEAVAPRRPRDRPRDELVQVDAQTPERLDRPVERARRVVGDERERGPPFLGLPVDARVRRDARRSACTPRDGRRRRRRSRSARGAVRPARWRSPPASGRRSSATCRAASAVVAAAIAVAHGIPATSARHWSSATGCERITRISSSGTSPTRDEAVPDAQCRLGHDRERVLVEQVVRLGDRAGERALDRQHAEVDLAARRRLDDREEARQRPQVGAVREQSLARGGAVGAVTAGVGDCDGCVGDVHRDSVGRRAPRGFASRRVRKGRRAG